MKERGFFKKNGSRRLALKCLMALALSFCILLGPVNAPVFAGLSETLEYSAAAFSQETVVDGVRFVFQAEPGAIASDTGIFIEWRLDSDFEAWANSALGINPGDGRTVVYHNIFRLTGADVTGKAHLRVEQLGFTDWASQYSGAALSVYALSYRPDEAANPAVILESVYSQDQIAFDFSSMGEYDVAAVLLLPPPAPVEEDPPESEPAPTAEPLPEQPVEPAPAEDGEAEMIPEEEPEMVPETEEAAAAETVPEEAADTASEENAPAEPVADTEEAPETIAEIEILPEADGEAESAEASETDDGSEEAVSVEQPVVKEETDGEAEAEPAAEEIPVEAEPENEPEAFSDAPEAEAEEESDAEAEPAEEYAEDAETVPGVENAGEPAVEEYAEDAGGSDGSEENEAAEQEAEEAEITENSEQETAEPVSDESEAIETEDPGEAGMEDAAIEDIEENESSEPEGNGTLDGAEPPAEEPIEGPVETPVEEPVEATAEAPAEEPVEAPAEAPAEETEAQIETLIEETDMPAEEPITVESEESDREDEPAQDEAIDETPVIPSISETETEEPTADAEKPEAIEIVKQPEDQTGVQGDTIRFSVAAIGGSLTYQWQRSSDGDEWTDIRNESNAFDGALTSELSFTATAATISRQYRCVVSNGDETVTTQPVSVVTAEMDAAVSEEKPAEAAAEAPSEEKTEEAGEEQDEAPETSEPADAGAFEIVLQPENATGKDGDMIRFTTEASESGLTYQWQRSSDGEEWVDIRNESSAFTGALTPELTFIGTSATITKLYRCVISNGETVLTTRTVAVMAEEEAPAQDELPPEEEDAQTEAESDVLNPESEPESVQTDTAEPDEAEAEEAEPDIVSDDFAPAELPANRSVHFVVEWDDDLPTIGSVAHFKAILDGYDHLIYTLQWQFSEDGQTWENLEGADEMNMDREITLDNYEYYWRVAVTVKGIQEE